MSAIKSASKEDYPMLLKPQRKHIGVLRERADYLEQRIEATPDGAASYHVSELEALEWALYIIDEEFKYD